MRAVVYARVSTEEQASEGYSIDAQVGRCREYCEAQGWQIVEEYLEPGASARSAERPVFKQMLRDAEAGLFDVLVVHKLDRFSRSLRDTLNLMSDLCSWGSPSFPSRSSSTSRPLLADCRCKSWEPWRSGSAATLDRRSPKVSTKGLWRDCRGAAFPRVIAGVDALNATTRLALTQAAKTAVTARSPCCTLLIPRPSDWFSRHIPRETKPVTVWRLS